MKTGRQKGVEERGQLEKKKIRKFSSDCGTQTHHLLAYMNKGTRKWLLSCRRTLLVLQSGPERISIILYWRVCKYSSAGSKFIIIIIIIIIIIVYVNLSIHSIMFFVSTYQVHAQMAMSSSASLSKE